MTPDQHAKRSRILQIVCHCGANYVAPENTLIAAQICFEHNYDFVELDARTSADGRLVVLHDETVDRTTDGSGVVSALTWSELCELDAGSWFHSKYSDQRIPLLSEMLALASKHGGLYIELKDVDPQSMLNEVAEENMMQRCFFGSENPQAMREVRALAPRAILMARRCDFSTLRAAVEDCQSQIIEFDQTVDDLSELPNCRAFGVKSMIYDQTHQVAAMEAAAALGPDLINVDRPDIAASVRARLTTNS